MKQQMHKTRTVSKTQLKPPTKKQKKTTQIKANKKGATGISIHSLGEYKPENVLTVNQREIFSIRHWGELLWSTFNNIKENITYQIEQIDRVDTPTFFYERCCSMPGKFGLVCIQLVSTDKTRQPFSANNDHYMQC